MKAKKSELTNKGMVTPDKQNFRFRFEEYIAIMRLESYILQAKRQSPC